MSRERIAALPKTDWRTRNDQFKEPKLSENLKLVERLRAAGTRHGRAPGEVAIAWTLRHPAVTGAIVGARDSKQMDGIIGAMDFRLTTAEIAELEGP
jgi:aryl-alcohol dehydrogenase-like predicted oxidoreductase